MSWPRASLYCALLMLAAPWVSADTITVNTTTDDNANNTLCSLREAVEYFNHNKPAKGYQGCKSGASDSSDIVKLPAKTQPYQIVSGHIPILASLSIQGDGRAGGSVTTIQVVGAHRAFVINFDPDYQSPECLQSNSCSSGAITVGSDTDNDFKVNTQQPQFTVGLSGAALPADQAYLVRLYDNHDDKDPVVVGTGTTTFSGGTTSVDVTLTTALSLGVHYLTYTTQVVDAVSGEAIGEESAPLGTVTLAVYSDPTRINVSLSQLVLKGCADAAGCANQVAEGVPGQEIVVNAFSAPDYDKYALTYKNLLSEPTSGYGGIIFNSERLTLNNVEMQDGVALTGGAIYLYGITTTSGITTVTDGGSIELVDGYVHGNKADKGAAIYAEKNAVSIKSSLIEDNAANGMDGAVIEVADSVEPTGSSLGNSLIENSTFSDNAPGDAVLIQDGMSINASTIVRNAGGVNFGGKSGAVYNSIIAENFDPDTSAETNCRNQALATVLYSLVPLGSGCLTAGTHTPTQTFNASTTVLIATAGPDGSCPLDGDALLCPLADHGGATPVYLPRILTSASSPLINNGSVDNSGAGACPSADQRSKSRSSGSGRGCDIGAVQFQQVAEASVARSGNVIKYGETYSQSLGDDLEDEMLLPASKCSDFGPPQVNAGHRYPPATLVSDLSKVVPDSYDDQVSGCPWLETQPTHGNVSFSETDPSGGSGASGYYDYQPTSDFHGFDQFRLRVVTTTSYLNSQTSDRSRPVSVRIIMEPADSLTSSKVGAWDGGELIILGMVAVATRRRKTA